MRDSFSPASLKHIMLQGQPWLLGFQANMSDNTARAILIVGMLTATSVSGWHRFQARTGERLDRRQEGWWILLSVRPLAAVMLIGLVAYLISPSSMAWSSLPLPAWARWLGAWLGAFGIGFLFWTLRSLGHNLTDTVVTRRGAVLVIHGPYRWIRHPFYVSLLLGVIAISAVAANWFLLVTGVGVFVLLAIRASKEEQNLIDRFGDDYEQYMRRTGRFLPRLRRGPK